MQVCLSSIQDPMVPLVPGGGTGRPGVRTIPGFGEAETTNLLTVQIRGYELLLEIVFKSVRKTVLYLLFSVSEVFERTKVETVVGGHDDSTACTASTDFCQAHRVGERVKPGPA